jgi:thiol-disulfide isomerase/thioredoxin
MLKNNSIIIIITIVLSIVAIGSYYTFKNQLIQPIDSVVFFNDENALTQLYHNTPQKNITVVYFWDNQCPCNASVLPHFQQLVKEYSEKGVRFLLADLSQTSSNTLPDIAHISTEKLNTLKATVTHTPSTAIWNHNGELVYYGAHNMGYICNAETSFIQKVLEGIFEQRSISALNTMGDGCFCARN